MGLYCGLYIYRILSSIAKVWCPTLCFGKPSSQFDVMINLIRFFCFLVSFFFFSLCRVF